MQVLFESRFSWEAVFFTVIAGAALCVGAYLGLTQLGYRTAGRWISGVLLAGTVLLVIAAYSDEREMAGILRDGRCRIVEGVVRRVDFDGRYETVDVDGTQVRYGKFVVSSAYAGAGQQRLAVHDRVRFCLDPRGGVLRLERARRGEPDDGR